MQDTQEVLLIAFFIDGEAKGTSIALDKIRDVLAVHVNREDKQTEYYRLVAGGIEDNVLYFSTNPTDLREVNRSMMAILGQFVLQTVGYEVNKTTQDLKVVYLE